MRKKTIGALLVAALLGLVTLQATPASASPCVVGPDPGWVTVSNGSWAGYVSVSGPDKWREVCWTVQYYNYDAENYFMIVKYQDLVDTQEPDSDGWIDARYATPGNLVWRDDWTHPKEWNSADWQIAHSSYLNGRRSIDGPPSGWHVQFQIVATGTGGARAYQPVVRSW